MFVKFYKKWDTEVGVSGNSSDALDLSISKTQYDHNKANYDNINYQTKNLISNNNQTHSMFSVNLTVSNLHT